MFLPWASALTTTAAILWPYTSWLRPTTLHSLIKGWPSKQFSTSRDKGVKQQVSKSRSRGKVKIFLFKWRYDEMLTQCAYFVALVLDNVHAYSPFYRINSLTVDRHLVPCSKIGTHKGFPRLLWFFIVSAHHTPNHWNGNVWIPRGSVITFRLPVYSKRGT